MSEANEKSEEGGTLRYAVPFKGSVLVNVEGIITVEMPSDMPLPRQSAARCVLMASKENGIFFEPMLAFEGKLPHCNVTYKAMGCEVDEPQQTFSVREDSDLRMVWTIEDSSEEVPS